MATGLNIDMRKINNRNVILNIIQNNQDVSRIEIKKISKYSMSTVLSVVEDLLDKKMIVEAGVGDGRVGRKPTWLEINPDGGYFLGVEFNAEFMYSVVLNFAGQVIFTKRTQVLEQQDNVTYVVDKLKNSIKEMIAFVNKPNEKIIGIGIGAPGYVDNIKGESIYYSHLKNWKNVQLKELLEKEFSIKTCVESNVNAMALAYKWLKPEIYNEDFILLSIRTGIKMSLMLNNQLYRGRNNTAGEIGHVRVMSSNRICSCGKKGCLETEASDDGIQTKLLEGIAKGRYKDMIESLNIDQSGVNMLAFVESIKLGHKDSLDLLDEVCEYLGDALSAVVNLVNPSRIIISGKITSIGEPLIRLIEENLREKAIFVGVQDLKIEISSFDENIGALGAAAIIMQNEFEFVLRSI